MVSFGLHRFFYTTSRYSTIGGGTQVHRLTVKHGDLVRFQPQDQRPTTAHRSALIHADAAGLFGREIQQRITPPLASTVSFSIRTIAVT